MHDHGTMTVSSMSIDQMDVMWAFMALMAIHHVWMWWKMRGKK